MIFKSVNYFKIYILDNLNYLKYGSILLGKPCEHSLSDYINTRELLKNRHCGSSLMV